MMSGERLTKIQTTTRPDHVSPEVWTKIGKAAQNREKQEWAKEKPRLDNARKVRRIYFIDPDDKEHSEILKNARKKVERPMAPAMPCKRDQQHPSIVKTNAEPKTGNESEFKTVYGCTVESHESTIQRAESLQSKTHEDRIAGKGFTLMAHYNLVHKFIPMPQAMKIPDAKVVLDKEWKNARDNSSLGLGKSQEQKGGYSGSTKRQKESPLSLTDWRMSPQKNAELEPKLQKYKGSVVLRVDIVKDDAGAYTVFTEQGSSASQMTAAKIMDVLARLPGCDGQAPDAVSAYTQVKIGGCFKIAQNSQFGMSRCLDTSSTTQMTEFMGQKWRSRGTSRTKLVRWSISWFAVEETIWTSFIGTSMGENSERGMYVRSSETGFSVSICGWHKKWPERSRTWLLCGGNWWKNEGLANLHHFLTTCTWDALSVNANRMKQSKNSTRGCLSQVFLLEQQKHWRSGRNLSHKQKRGPATWKDMILWCGKQESGATLQSFASLFGWPSSQTGGTGISWRIVRSLLANCLEMLVRGKNWTTWHLVVSEQARKMISHKMDSSMWQTISKADFLSSSHKWQSSMLSCGKRSTTLQTCVISRLRLCRRPWGLKVKLRRCLVYFWKLNSCPCQLDVQETNIGFAQFYRIWSYF